MAIRRKLSFFIVKDRYCNICGRETAFLSKTGHSNIFTMKNQVIGIGERKNTVCLYCLSIDRFRWIWYVLEHYVDLENKKILHFAPEKCFKSNLEKKIGKNHYYAADIVPGREKFTVDIQDIQFADETFDISIANMVLEHVKDEKKAVKELMRVTRHGGDIIITVPIALNLDHLYEDVSNLSEEERIRKFGQHDHMRIYGKDVKEHFESFGLSVKEYIVEDILTDEEIRKMGLLRQDRVFICKNP